MVWMRSSWLLQLLFRRAFFLPVFSISGSNPPRSLALLPVLEGSSPSPNSASARSDTPIRALRSDTGANPVMPVPHPSPDARRRRKWRRRLFRVTIGGTIPVLVSSSAAPIRTTTIRRSVIAPLFENAVAIGQTALRRRSGSTADQQQGGGYKFRDWLHKPLRCLLLLSSQLVGAVRVPIDAAAQRHHDPGRVRSRNDMGPVNKCDHPKSRAGIHKNIAELSHSRA